VQNVGLFGWKIVDNFVTIAYFPCDLAIFFELCLPGYLAKFDEVCSLLFCTVLAISLSIIMPYVAVT
jgi:hypothetical protein